MLILPLLLLLLLPSIHFLFLAGISLIVLTAAVLPEVISGVKAVVVFLGWRRALTLYDLLLAGFAPGGKVVFGLELMKSLL
uniref:Uncharacterized protein n=1 Tax=Poecilia latipinna TaxID=48699 RepID=A0A3B3VP48_9TELE